jgi:hypothetical protein
MATIITVHGTHATRPELGAKWWQNGSGLETQLLALIESERGALSLQPFVWDGRNSENSRRKAGSELLARALELERVAEPYCIIGHSHGGSVIELALFQAAARGNPLPNLKQWISVGTPFVVSRRRFFLFSRLNVFGKAIYLAWMMIVAASLASLVFALTANAQTDQEGLIVILQLLAGASLFIVSIIFYFVLRRLERRNPIRRKGKVLRSARALFAERWTSLWHRHDEAMQGLAALRKLHVNIFARDYAVEPLSLAGVFLLPIIAAVIAAWMMVSPPIRAFFMSLIGAALKQLPPGLPGAPLGPMPYPSFLRELYPIPEFILVGLVGAAALAITASLIVLIVRVLSVGLSLATSGHLNRQVHEQAKRKAFGGDVLGERAIDVALSPVWSDRQFAALPAELSREIELFCDRETLRTIPKLRERIASLALAKVSVIAPEDLANELTWNELIHTSYFEVGRFCKLLAYTIARGDGFRTTETFKSDPDYVLAARWFEEIQPRKGAAIETDAASRKRDDGILEREARAAVAP